MKIEELKLELNEAAEEIKNKAAHCNFSTPGGSTLMITPPLNGAFWLLRVKVSEKQAVVGFPKFGTIGIGFAVEEEDWNTNLPYCADCGADGIYEHIKDNAKVDGDDNGPTKDVCVAAIQMVIDGAKQLRPIEI